MTKRELRKYFEYLPNGTFKRKTSSNRWFEGLEISGSLRLDGYLSMYFNRKARLFHRVVYTWHFGSIGKKDIDHINGDRSDNRIKNLRLATRSQNVASLHQLPSNRYGVCGLRFRRGRWVGQVSWERKRHEVSSKIKAEAILKLVTLRKKLHGDFAKA